MAKFSLTRILSLVFCSITFMGCGKLQVVSTTPTSAIATFSNTYKWSTASQAVSESVGTVTLTAQLTHTETTNTVIPFTVSGTATGADHNAANGSITVPAGNSSANYTFTVTDDSLYENAETVIFTLGNASGMGAITPSVQTVTINDNDTAPAVNFSVASQSVAESDGTVTVTAQLSGVSGASVLVPFTVTGTATNSDHSAVNSTITIPAGSTSANYTFTVTDDTNYETSETVIFTMGTVVGATKGATDVHTVTITDNDAPPSISIASASGTEGGVVTFTVTQSSASSYATTFTWDTSAGTAASGTDYTAVSGATATIPAGATSTTLSVTTVDDTIYEGAETFSVTISSPSNATIGTATATGTINDNDSQPSLSIADLTVAEGVGTATLTISASNASTQDMTVNWATAGNTATSGVDFQAGSSTATITAGSTTTTLTVSIIDDTLNEANETFSVTLSSPSQATISDNIAVVTITDDDGPATVISVTSSVANGTFGASATIPVQVVFSQSMTVTGTPRLQLATAGGVDEYVNYSSGSGSTTLVFNYLVQVGDVASDLDYLSTSALTLNGGTITDGVDNGVLTLPTPGAAGSLGANKNIVIDSQAPTTPTSVDDGANSRLTSSPTITWGASTDVGSSGLSYYEVAIGTSAGASNTLTWTNVGNVTSYQATGLTLTTNTTYYASVRAVDSAGNISTVAQGDGWLATALPATQQQAFLKAPNVAGSQELGWAVAIDGNTAVLGAPQEGSNQTTITNGSTASSDTSLGNAGAVYVYLRTGSTWAQQAYLKPPNPTNNYLYGYSVAISGDTIIVGSPQEDSNQTTITNDTTASSDTSSSNAGAAYIYTRSGSTWAQQAYVKPSNTLTNENFGWSVAVDTDTAAVGARWEVSNQTTITNGTTASSDTSSDQSGAVFVYFRTGSTWAQQAYLKSPINRSYDFLGTSVAISGDTIIAGAPGDDNQTAITNGSVLTSNPTNSESGAAYVFQRTGSTWEVQAYLKAPSLDDWDHFGTSVAISGNTALVGAPRESSAAVTITNGTLGSSDNSAVDSGAAYIFERTSGTWAQQAMLKPANTGSSDAFGTSVGLSGNIAVVGAPYEDSNQTTITNGSTASANNSNADAGAAYIFLRSGSTWAQQTYLKAPQPDAGDHFGSAVTVSGTTTLTGAYSEASNQNTITNGTTASTDNSLTNAGAGYIFISN